MIQQTYILDTNVYGELLIEDNREELVQKIETNKNNLINASPIAKYLAEDYLKKLKKYSEKNLRIDFLIIAVASLNSVDIVVSSDKRTMLSDLSKKVYGEINRINSLRTPKLLEYKKFKEVYLK